MKKMLYPLMAVSLAAVTGCGTAPIKSAGGVSKDWVGRQYKEFSVLAKTMALPDSLRLLLKGDDLFKVGSSRMTKDGAAKVDSIAGVLKGLPKDQVVLLVFTDDSGKPAHNRRLTQWRANRIKSEMVRMGLEASRVKAIGEGESQPVVPNDDAADRAMNRRAEMDITRM